MKYKYILVSLTVFFGGYMDFPQGGFGGVMTATQLFWFVQSQADVMIAGRVLDPHSLGVYTTGLFLAQLLAAKFVPPINEVAYAAYSRQQGEGQSDSGSSALLATIRLVMMVGLPAYAGIAVVAPVLVPVLLGRKVDRDRPAAADPGGRDGDADAADPVLARDQCARFSGDRAQGNDAGRGGDAAGILDRFQLGHHRLCLGLGRGHGGANRGDDPAVASRLGLQLCRAGERDCTSGCGAGDGGGRGG